MILKAYENAAPFYVLCRESDIIMCTKEPKCKKRN